MTSVEAVTAAIDALDRAAIPYMLVGSFSSNYYGIPRSTKDADFVIELGDKSIASLASLLPPGMTIDAQASFETITGSTRYEAVVRGLPFRIEFFLLSDDPHHQERFARRRPAELCGRSVHVPSPEDVIIQKLKWIKLAKRNKDIDDVRNVLAVRRADFDWDYIHRWCDAHGTRGMLDEIRRSIPDIPD